MTTQPLHCCCYGVLFGVSRRRYAKHCSFHLYRRPWDRNDSPAAIRQCSAVSEYIVALGNTQRIGDGYRADHLKAIKRNGGLMRVVELGKAQDEVGAWVFVRFDRAQSDGLEAMSLIAAENVRHLSLGSIRRQPLDIQRR